MKRIYITGISGTGKTAIAKSLEEKGIYCVSIEDTPGLCQWRNKETKEMVGYAEELKKEFIDTHEWVCDVEKLKELLDTNRTVIVTGVTSNQTEYLNLFDEILLLQCSPETFITRIRQRTDNDFGKDESAQKILLSWYKKFESNMLNRGAKSIDAEKPLKEVVEEVLTHIQ